MSSQANVLIRTCFRSLSQTSNPAQPYAYVAAKKNYGHAVRRIENPVITKFKATLVKRGKKDAGVGEDLVTEWQVERAGAEELEYWLQWSK